ncbi:MAG: FtsX-like permease family protein [Chitinophagales bacterium]|nr:FtsX-like permease family protein [Chitinophagales bacterium]
MNLALTFARRYFISKKSSNAINIISWVSVLGMVVGSMGLIIVLSVFNGFEGLVISLYNTFTPDFTITAREGKTFSADSSVLASLKTINGVRAISQVVEENALLNYGDKQYIATVKGVELNYGALTGIDSAMYEGSFFLKDKESNFAVIGLGIQQALGINYNDPFGYLGVYIPKKGKKTVINPEDAFNQGLIKPSGSFAIQAEFDNKYVFVPIEFARQLTGNKHKITSLEVALDKGADNASVQKQVAALFGTRFEVKNHLQQNEILYKVMKTEKWAVYAILTFILIVAAFNIIGSLSMLVIEKKKDIGILKTMGANERLIRRIFLYEGFLLSFIGCCTGFFLALIIILIQQKFHVLKIHGGSFVIDSYPVRMKIGDFILVFFTVITIGLLAAWFPSWKAARNNYRMAQE